MIRTITIKVDYIKEHESWRYKGVNENEKTIFQKHLTDCTEGICEFIGVTHALMHVKKTGIISEIYTKNEYIKQCIEDKKYKHEAKGEKSNEILKNCKMWLTDYRQTIIINLIPKQNETEKI